MFSNIFRNNNHFHVRAQIQTGTQYRAAIKKAFLC